METKYTFKQNKSGNWDILKGKQLICGGYRTQNDAAIGLATDIKRNRLYDELVAKGVATEKLLFKNYEELLEIEADHTRYDKARKNLEATQQKVLTSGKGKMFYGITGNEVTANYEYGDYKTRITTIDPRTLFFVDDFCDSVKKALEIPEPINLDDLIRKAGGNPPAELKTKYYD
ncbi:hypothetical protein CLV62_12033 [Dysgonomonas alginatilytica]|uniref:Uncharacterized protein n=1 Tax=Dysgonomonas alginatilytica TaxID=1605892 RepID=A0A2V3PNT6_9BACT|nr:hypothetical protein [Dysgonomonas alginatilytica]PXV62345.1 hypothetical protein CLV62_12033 [Dysgonomonas alginatilytica]